MKGVNTRLSVMMFLQFFVWGAWYTTIAVYMTNQGMGTLTHWPYTVNPIAAIAAPFFVGLVADRFFATERVFGILHLLGGVLLLAAPQTSGNPTLFIIMLLLYNLCYMPTITTSPTRRSSSRASASGGRSAGSSPGCSSASGSGRW
jgi:predicted MFS family arabinose efflux permease